MKTLDEIINNAEYKRLNGALLDRSFELAEKIRLAMESAELESIGNYVIRTVKARSGFSDTTLNIVGRNDDGYPVYRSLEHDNSFYFTNDFSALIQAATGKDRLKFVNDAKKLLIWINDYKSKRMEAIKSALEVTSQL